MPEARRVCPDCQCDISSRHWMAIRCKPCSRKREAQRDRERQHRTMYDHVCGQCGRSFMSRVKRSRFCSPRCSGLASVVEPIARICIACAEPFVGRVETCSQPCRYWIKRHPGVPVPKDCGWCAMPIVGRQRGSLFCSRLCAIMTTQSRRRARKRKKPVHRVLPRDIFERDRWTCHICTEPIDRTQHAQHPLAPALDHLIPIAHPAYPGHVAANLAAAHWGCNTAKGSRLTDADLTMHLLLLADMVPGEPIKRRPWSAAGVQTHCINGHEFTEDNTYWRPDGGGRQCRTCINDRQRARYRREPSEKREARMVVLRGHYGHRRPMTRNRVIRAWARAQGMDVKVKARIPAHVQRAFDAVVERVTPDQEAA